MADSQNNGEHVKCRVPHRNYELQVRFKGDSGSWQKVAILNSYTRVVPSWDDLMKAALADGANMGRLVRELQFLCVKHTQRILLKSSAQGCQHWHCE